MTIQNKRIFCRRPFRLFSMLLVFSFSLVWSSLSFAWEHVNHWIIAQVAYQQLKPKAKQRVGYWLAQSSFIQKEPKFLYAATWPDDLKSHGIETFTSWHFINLHDPKDNPKFGKHYVNSHNVVWAIEQSRKILRNPEATAPEKGLFLSFLIHFVGDIHQPLHCIEQYNAAHPKGDKGGNDIKVLWHGNSMSLHALWDKGAVLEESETRQLTPYESRQIAQRLVKKYPIENFSVSVKISKPSQWAKESYDIAREFAYNTPAQQEPNEEYLKTRQRISEERVVLAGYRLAEMLNEVAGS